MAEYNLPPSVVARLNEMERRLRALERTPRSFGFKSDNVATSEQTISGSYTDLATVGPEVEIAVPSGKMIVALGGFCSGGETFTAYMSFQAVGPETISADDSRAIKSTAVSNTVQGTRIVTLEDLTPGIYTVTAKYKSAGGIGFSTFSGRDLLVIPV